MAAEARVVYCVAVVNKVLSLALLIGGIVLIISGASASDSLGSDFSRFFTGAPTDKAIWLLVGGIVAAALGAGGLMFPLRTR